MNISDVKVIDRCDDIDFEEVNCPNCDEYLTRVLVT